MINIKYTWFIYAVALTLGLASCSGSSNKKSEDTGSQKDQKAAEFVYQPEYTSIQWTAYKFTKRVGVSGTFNSYEVQLGSNTTTPKNALTGLNFTIATSSNDSKNEERDGKIAEHFFGTMMNTENITGEVISVSGTDTAGKAKVAITMNSITHEVDADYSIAGGKVKLNTSLQMADWKAESSISALNKVCEALHTGEDGISILWPDVDVEVVSTLRSM
jgi:hypothetical protein